MQQITETQQRKINRLITKECANYDILTGNCLPLDCKCVQMTSLHVMCRYCAKCIIPLDPKLQAEIYGSGKDRCVKCHKPFTRTSPRQKYCSQCAIKAETAHAKVRMRNKRAS